MSVKAGESYRFEQEVFMDGHLYGSTNNEYPRGGQCQIERGTDGYFWNGSTFVVTELWVPTVVDDSGLFHYYDWDIPIGAVDGMVFHFRIRIMDDPSTETSGHMEVRSVVSGGGIVRKRILIVDD